MQEAAQKEVHLRSGALVDCFWINKLGCSHTLLLDQQAVVQSQIAVASTSSFDSIFRLMRYTLQ